MLRKLASIFVDQNYETSICVKSIWDSLFPNTSSIKTNSTPKGTKIYRIYANRIGIINYYRLLQIEIQKYGDLAGLWWKQEQLKKRYETATNNTANKLQETKIMKEEWKIIILDYLKENQFASFNELKLKLNLSSDRLRLLLKTLASEKRLYLIHASKNSKYLTMSIKTSNHFLDSSAAFIKPK
jgi:hypothetical protein